MKTFRRLWTIGMVPALFTLVLACDRGGESLESEEMDALFLEEVASDPGTDEPIELAEPGEDEGQTRGFGDPEVGSVDLDIPQREEPTVRVATPDPEPEPVVEEPAGPVIQAGTRVALSSDLEVSTEDALPGDPVTATVTDAVISPEGEVLIPAGAQLLGRVARAEESAGPDSDPVLEIEFETLSTLDFEAPLYAFVVEAEMESSRKDSDKRTAAKIGGAAAAGAILGKVLGKDTKDAVTGGVAGAVAGTVIAMETRQGHAKIKEGALIVVEIKKDVLLQ